MFYCRRKYQELRSTSSARRGRGAILLAVLWMIVMITVLVLLYTELGLKKIKERAIVFNPDSMREAAYSALEISLAVVNEFKEIDGAIYGPQQGWGDPLEYSGITLGEKLQVDVRFTDETSKIPLISENVEMLRTMLETQGIDGIDQEILLNSLADWTDEDDAERPNGAEESYYEFQDPPVLPPNRPIADYDELRYIRGFEDAFFDPETGAPNEAFLNIMSSTSLHHDLPININTAENGVMDTLYEDYPLGLENVLDEVRGDDGELGTEDDRFVKESFGGSNFLGNEVGVLRAEIEVRRGDAYFLLSALVAVSDAATQTQNRSGSAGQGGASYPFTILKIAENTAFE